MSFSTVILAGGKSSRMGRDKAWLDVEGRPLIARQIDLVRSVGAREVLISGRREVDYSALGCPVVRDRFPDAGPLAGIEAGLRASSLTLVLVLAVDLPQMTQQVLGRILGCCAEATGAIPRLAGAVEPLAAVYPQSAVRLLESMLSKPPGADATGPSVKSPSARAFAEQCGSLGLAQFVDFTSDNAGAFANWNAPADMG